MKKELLENKLVIGTAQFGMNYGVSNKMGMVNIDEIKKILKLAHHNGIDTLDTAKHYDKSEERIGMCIGHYISSSWKVITKADNNEVSLLAQIDDSIKKLQRKPSVVLARSSDLYMKKSFQDDLILIKEKKMTDKIGLSIYSVSEIDLILESSIKPDIIQIPMSILDTRLYRNKMIEHLYSNNIEIHARSIFLQGLFYLSDHEINKKFPDVFPYILKLKAIASKCNLTLPELSLLWLISLKEINKIIVGVESATQLGIHLETMEKDVDPRIFELATSLNYENENILNPSLWKAGNLYPV